MSQGNEGRISMKRTKTKFSVAFKREGKRVSLERKRQRDNKNVDRLTSYRTESAY